MREEGILGAFMKKYVLVAGMGLLSSLFLPGCETGVSAGETYNYGPYNDQGFGWGDDWNYGWNDGWDYEWRNREWYRKHQREEFRAGKRAGIRQSERKAK